MNEQKSLVTVDQRIAEYEESKAILLHRYVKSLTAASGLPAHIVLANQRTDLSPHKRLAMMGTYEGGIIVDLEKYINKVVTVLGCIVFEHGPFQGLDGEDHPGYSFMLIKTDKKKNVEVVRDRKVIDIPQHVIIKSSGQFVNDFFLSLMNMDRPMDFKEPITVFFTGSRTKGYHCQPVDPDIGNTMEDYAQNRTTVVEERIPEHDDTYEGQEYNFDQED